MGWQSWKLSDWNRALAEAVFLDLERLALRITRIQASSKFLAQCTGDPSCGPSEAMRAFTSSFGATSAGIMRHFKWHGAIESRTARNGLPEVFAALYLTLLAASADEDTYAKGDLRDRFIELFKSASVRRPGFGDLPLLWEHLADWSRTRARQRGDCRVLVLPDWGNERRIGYSKRLAFPAYSDEIKLQALLRDLRLSSDSDFRHVANAVSSRRSSFSPSFLEEFELFLKLVSRSKHEDAYDSPFWGAIQAITWDEDKAASLRAGSFCLGIYAADPEWPEFYLLADEPGHTSLGSAASCRSLPVQTSYLYSAQLPDGAPWTPAKLHALASARPRLAQAKLWKRLAVGCIALFPDSQGGFTTDGDYCDGSSAWLLVHGKFGPSLHTAARHLGLKPKEARAGGLFGAWTILFFESISASAMARLADGLPDQARQALPGSWRPPRILCTGGAWYGQALLLNPASVPLFGLPGADAGSYELVGGGTAAASGPLEEVDGGFRVPPSALAARGAADTLCVSLSRREQVLGQLRVPLAKHIPMNPPLRPADPHAWLADGRSGCLAGLASESGSAPLHARPAGIPALHPWLEHKALPLPAGPANSGLDDVPELLGWLCEALSLRLQRRQSLAFADLDSHLEPACTAAEAPRWIARRLLFGAGWLALFQRRNSPYPIVAPAPRTIALHSAYGTMQVARIAGMFPESERARLLASLGPGESALRLVPPGRMFGIGAIEVRLSGEARIAELASRFELDVLSREAATPPLFLAPQFFKPDQGAEDALRAARDAEAWNPARRRWAPAESPERPPARGSIVRTSGQQRRAFWIAVPGGWLKTDSEAWAFMLSLSAQGKPLGQVDGTGSCWLDAELDKLPLPLVRWWMHWGGGCVSVTPSGNIVLASSTSLGAWDDLRSWFPAGAADAPSQNRFDTARQRRGLALSLRKGLRLAGY